MTEQDRKDAHNKAIEREFLVEFLECAKYDILMSGPVFRSWNRSALDRLLRRVRNYFDTQDIGL